MKDFKYLKVQGRLIQFSNLEKIYYPESGFKKQDVLRYYQHVSKVLLPHLRRRPITLKRYPEGVSGEYFYEKRCPQYKPEWVDTAEMNGVTYCSVGDLASLLWLVNLSSIELHTNLAREPHTSRPDMIAFDLDPGAPAGLLECAEIALKLRDFLEMFGLKSFPKTSGSKGIQVYVPLNSNKIDYEDTKSFARAVAEQLERASPEKIISRMAKNLRPGKVFIDWSQNTEHKTTVSVYSLRATASPQVSTPLGWRELERALKARDRAALIFSPAQVVQRIAKLGDLFEPVLNLKQRLPDSRLFLESA